MRSRPGFTLVELVVVVAILAVVAAVGGIAFAALARDGREAPSMPRRVREARREAVRRGVAVSVVDSAAGRAPVRATAFPDGRVVADSAVGVDPLTGVAAREGA